MKKLFTSLTFALTLLICNNAFSTPKLNSYPSAVATIFLDFDGQYVESTVWNGGNSINCAPSGLNEAQITEAFNRVAEDYRPFNINITTDSTVYLAAPLNKRMRVIITTTSGWMPGVGGISYVGSFTWGDDTPAFVFSDRLGPYSPKMVGECCSHESGHTVGLSHQSKYGSDCSNPLEQYNSGEGSGETGWAPIMGNSYYRNMSNWNNGPTPYGCTSIQDNLTIIATQNGFGFRTDDFAETLDVNTYNINASNFTVNGIIGTSTDKDAFKFTLNQSASLHLTAIPFNVGANYIGANLDIRVELYNASATLITTYDPENTMSVTIDTFLTAGTYYLKIHGTGNTNIGAYGSLGAYTLNGYTGILPIHDVTLTGNTNNNKHNLNWRIISDEPIKTIEIQSSADGSNFNVLNNAAASTVNFSYQPYKSNTIYYRLKVTSVINQIVYSNIIALKTSGKADYKFNVSTFVQSNIVVNAAEDYQYMLMDMNGRIINKGKGLKGIAHIDVSNQPNGMYVIQLFANNEQKTERIIKQ
ncbi:MAG TPA: T9SS type A sorting domain-containing protein [Ferruginibacter sp.]|nr:T9SS type A sorting domain-containing protein [Ferruginibacter sp.]